MLSQRIIVEEWASFNKELFRLDLISDNTRITYLTHGKTNEIFRYQPFVCDRLSSDSAELGVIGNLFKGYSLDKKDSGTYAYGLGPMWLRAQENATSIKLSSQLAKKNRKHEFITQYAGKCYDVNFGSAPKDEFDLRFYFRPEKYRFVDAVEWIGVAANKKPTVGARAKLIRIDKSPVDDSVFELPVGYGCTRSPLVDHPIGISLGLQLLHTGTPNESTLQVTSSRPQDRLLRLWDTQQYTVSIMQGALKMNQLLHQYYVTRTTFKDAETARLKHLKRVWSALSSSEQAVVYTIDKDTGNCQVKHQKVKEENGGGFMIYLPNSSNNSSTSGVFNGADLRLSLDLIRSLFNDNDGFHLLREGKSLDSYRFNDVYYEKRLENLQAGAYFGEIELIGPVSIVKRISTFPEFIKDMGVTSVDKLTLMSGYRSTVTIFFYSDNYTQIQYKIALELLSSDEVDVSYMQKQLDIGACFDREQKQDIVIKYPIESNELNRRLQATQDIILELFCMNLFDTTPIQPLQVSDLHLTFDQFFLQFKLTLLDMPLIQTYEMYEQMGLVDTKPTKQRKQSIVDRSNLIEKLSPDIDKCSQACEYYKCFRFSFDSKDRLCKLELEQNSAETTSVATSVLYSPNESRIKSPWNEYDDSAGRVHLRPRAILRYLEEFVSYETIEENQDDIKEGDESIPLTIRLESEMLPRVSGRYGDDPVWIELRPSSLHSDIDSLNEFYRDGGDSANSSSIIVDDPGNLRVQYSLVRDGYVYASPNKIGGHLSEVLSYEDCELSCADSNCRSFSYCEHDKACHQTDWHATKDIERNTRFDPRCKVFTLDYLSKFEDFGPALTPSKTRKILSGGSKIASAYDCALGCINENTFNCQAFYYCSDILGKLKTCLLQDKHIEAPPKQNSPEENSQPKFVTRTRAELKLIKRGDEQCNFYSRSYLSQFDEYYEQELKLPYAPEIITGMSADSCAQQCVERSCLAFDICIDRKRKIGTRQTCRLAKREVRKNFLSTSESCTTFVLSDRSQFNNNFHNASLEKLSAVEGKPDRPALEASENSGEQVIVDTVQETSSSQDLESGILNLFESLNNQIGFVKDSSHWLARLMSLATGLLLGLILVGVWKGKDEIYNGVTNMTSRLRRR